VLSFLFLFTFSPLFLLPTPVTVLSATRVDGPNLLAPSDLKPPTPPRRSRNRRRDGVVMATAPHPAEQIPAQSRSRTTTDSPPAPDIVVEDWDSKPASERQSRASSRSLLKAIRRRSKSLTKSLRPRRGNRSRDSSPETPPTGEASRSSETNAKQRRRPHRVPNRRNDENDVEEHPSRNSAKSFIGRVHSCPDDRELSRDSGFYGSTASDLCAPAPDPVLLRPRSADTDASRKHARSLSLTDEDLAFIDDDPVRDFARRRTRVSDVSNPAERDDERVSPPERRFRTVLTRHCGSAESLAPRRFVSTREARRYFVCMNYQLPVSCNDVRTAVTLRPRPVCSADTTLPAAGTRAARPLSQSQMHAALGSEWHGGDGETDAVSR